MTITISATPVVSSPPRVQLTVSSSPAVTDDLSIVRVHADGSEHPVLGVGSLITTWSGFDVHMPYNVPVTYRAASGGLTATSAATAVVCNKSWLIHASDPDLSVIIRGVGPVAARTRNSRATSYLPIGNRNPVSRTDSPRGGPSGEIKLLSISDAETAAIDAFLDSDFPILINSVSAFGWMWVQPGNSITEYASGYVRDESLVTIPFSAVTQPDVNVALWRLGDLESRAVANYPLLGNLKSAYTGKTLRDLKLRVV